MPPDPVEGPDPDPGPGLARAAPPDAARERFFCGRHEGAPVPGERQTGRLSLGVLGIKEVPALCHWGKF